MSTLTEIVASVVVHSSAVAFSHFGVQMETPRLERPQPAAERVIVRTPARKIEKLSEKLSDCPEQRAAHIVKA
jgi:hypothetical protein